MNIEQPNYKRPSPPYPAKYYPGEIQVGNSGDRYESRNIKTGYRWFKMTSTSIRKRRKVNLRKRKSPRNKINMIKKGSSLTDKEQRYCRCVLHVAEKQSEDCLRGKKWLTKNGKCYNPYAVCSKSVGTSVKGCGLWYDYENLTKSELLGYAYLEDMKVSRSDTRRQIIKVIKSSLSSKMNIK